MSMNFDAFGQYLRELDRSPSTVASYLRELQGFARWFEQTNGEPLTPAALTGRDVRDFREFCQVNHGDAPATVNRRLAAIRAYGAWLVETEQLPGNPAERVKLIGEVPLAPHSLDRRQLAALERELERTVNRAITVVAKFLAARDRAMVLLLANTGLRVSELCALEIADVAISERSGSVMVRRGKGNKQRSVPLNVEARRALTVWLHTYAHAEGEALFCGLTPRGVQYAIKEYGRRACVPVTPHTLRHSFAKSLADAGVRAEEIAALLGHSKLETTRRYTQPTSKDLAAAVERLEG
jgi:site-specific recombinase XerD